MKIKFFNQVKAYVLKLTSRKSYEHVMVKTFKFYLTKLFHKTLKPKVYNKRYFIF